MAVRRRSSDAVDGVASMRRLREHDRVASRSAATIPRPMAREQTVTRLAQYRPFERQGPDARAAISDLVLATALEDDGRLPSLAACRENCKALWGLEVELDELRSVFDDLV